MTKFATISAVSALALFVALPATAADLISTPPPMVAAAVSDWSGVYIGAHVGYGLADIHDAGDPTWVNFDASGFLAGVQIGARQQSGDFVLGIQGDVSWANLKAHHHLEGEGDGPWFDDHDLTINWMASLTGRAGVVVDQALLYGLGGVTVAGGGVDETWENVWWRDDSSGTEHFTPHLFGVTVGAGAEFKLTDNVSIFGEYAFTQFADFDLLGGKHPGDPWMFGGHAHTVKVGLNYSF